MSGKNAQNICYFAVFEGLYFVGARENAFFDVFVFDGFVICVSRHLWRRKLQIHHCGEENYKFIKNENIKKNISAGTKKVKTFKNSKIKNVLS